MAHWWQTIPWRMVQTNLPDRAMADMDAARFARDLKDFGATVVNLNAAGIVANYETKLDFQPRNPYLTGDSLTDVVAACHAQGIRVIARTDFSRIQRAVYEQHPDWAARLADGRILDYNGYVSVCPNSAYLNEAMFAVLRELFAAIPFDGLYCNMSSVFLTDYDGNFHGVCRCERCRALYEQETGQPAPEAANPRDPALGPYVSFQMKRSARHKAKLKAFLKELDPELALDGVDFLRSEVSLDYDRPNWGYKASSNARLGAGPERARPSDDASVDFLGFRHRYISAPPALMALRQWQNLANAGSLSLYIMGRLDARRDTSALAPTRRVFQFHKAHELTDLRKEVIRDFYEEMRKAPKLTDGKPLSEKSVEGIHNTLCSILSDAVEEGYLLHNPAWRMYKPQGEKKERPVADEELVQRLIVALEGQSLKYETYFKLVLATGMRRGEACGLRWSDINWKQCSIHIQRNVVKLSHEPIFVKPPKTASGDRMVYVCPDDLIFTKQRKPIHPDTFSRHLRKLYDRNGFPKDYHLHTMRHFFATYLLENGTSKQVTADLLGHADTAFLERTYCHPQDTCKEQAAGLLDTMLQPADAVAWEREQQLLTEGQGHQ